MAELTESQRVKARMLKGVVSARKIARLFGVQERTIRRAWDVKAEREREARYRARARAKYVDRKHDVQISIANAYRGPGDGNEGVSACCPRCGRMYTQHDFRTDVVTGLVIEPTMCWRCVA